MLAVSAPMLFVVLTFIVGHPTIILDGDQAVDEMYLRRAEHLGQLLGNFSREGWNHPGPAWFYAMAPFYALSGSSSWGFAAAVVLLNGIAAALIVAVAWRCGQATLALITCVALLIYEHGLGSAVLLELWPPFVPVLPFIVFLLLAAVGAAGSGPARVGALLAGSYIAQVHVSTVPVAIAILAGMFAMSRFTRIGRAPNHGRSSRQRQRSRRLVGAGIAILIAMWIPPVYEEFTGRPGNLTKLFQFFLSEHTGHTPGEALSALARELAVFPTGRLPDFLDSSFAGLHTLRWVALLGVVAATGLLAVLSTRAKDRFVQALSILTLAALVVTWYAIYRVTGPIYPYFLVWVSAFPVVVISAWAAFLIRMQAVHDWPGLRRLRSLPVSVASGVACAAVVLALMVTESRSSCRRASWSTWSGPTMARRWSHGRPPTSLWQPTRLNGSTSWCLRPTGIPSPQL